ncbi:MAG: glycosyltransferase family 2 protein [Bacteroidales bacterium]|nr:glycosyltransferase family 2 protein [Bacteroidales bacterium]
MDLTVIVPVYHGEKTIRELYNRIKETLDGKFDYEILFIYDSGKDNSWEIIQELIGSDPSSVRGFRLVRNYGQHNALLFGMTKAHGDLIITMDEDFQHDPYHIPDLIAKQRTGDYDVVYGKFKSIQHPVPRIWASEMLRKLLILIVPGIHPDYSSFRLIKRSLAERINIIKNSYGFIDGYVGGCTEKITTVAIEHNRRTSGQSSYSFFKLLKHALFIVLAYSKVIIFLILTSFFVIISAVVLYIMNPRFNNPGMDRLVCLLFFVGIAILSVGLFTEIIYYIDTKRNAKISEIK